jgi:hypothetical protein
MDRIKTELFVNIPEVKDTKETMEVGTIHLPSKNSNNRNRSILPRIRTSSVQTIRAVNLEESINEDMRPRTYSMPTRNDIRKSHSQLLLRNTHRLPESAVEDKHNIRAFEINRKGVIVKRAAFVRSKTAHRIVPTEGYFGSPSSLSVSKGRPTIRPSTGLQLTSQRKIVVVGAATVGKTALTQQLVTSEYLGGFNTSIGESSD